MATYFEPEEITHFSKPIPNETSWRIYMIARKEHTTYVIEKKLKIFKYIFWYRYLWLSWKEYSNKFDAMERIKMEKEKKIKVKTTITLIHEE